MFCYVIAMNNVKNKICTVFHVKYGGVTYTRM